MLIIPIHAQFVQFLLNFSVLHLYLLYSTHNTGCLGQQGMTEFEYILGNCFLPHYTHTRYSQNGHSPMITEKR